jgi:hypothetical protein
MIFIVRNPRGSPPPGVRVILSRETPSDHDRQDFFCVADAPVADAIPLHDGWYADDGGGGIAVWGGGRFWEVRSTPLHVRQSDADG